MTRNQRCEVYETAKNFSILGWNKVPQENKNGLTSRAIILNEQYDPKGS